MTKRVVITGVGSFTSLGKNSSELWGNIKNGKSGINIIERFDTTNFPTKVGAEIKGYDPTDYLERRDVRRMDRFAQYALIAAREAFDNALLKDEHKNNDRFGVIIGSGVGGAETLFAENDVFLEKGYKKINSCLVPMMIPNMAAGRVAIEYGARGCVECVITACATSANAIGNAYHVIKRGEADIMISGGSDATLLPITFAGFCAANKAMSKSLDPNNASKPFDLNRDGFVMGEGGAIVILEEYEHAVKRNAPIICELVGYSNTCDAFHITAPLADGSGAYKCMKNALNFSGLSVSQIDYINAHGTATKLNDIMETLAVNNLLSEEENTASVSSTKSMTGHGMGSAGAQEVIISAFAIRDNFVPANTNFETIDPACDIRGLVKNKGINKEVNVAISNSFGFGGHNASIILKAINE